MNEVDILNMVALVLIGVFCAILLNVMQKQMSLQYNNIFNTGSVVYLSDSFVEFCEKNYPEQAFWNGAFKINVVPMLEEEKDISEYRVEFMEHPEGDTKKGFVLQMTPNNRIVPNKNMKNIECIPIIGRRV